MDKITDISVYWSDEGLKAEFVFDDQLFHAKEISGSWYVSEINTGVGIIHYFGKAYRLLPEVERLLNEKTPYRY